jgi:DNA-binding NtrC family response regulator
VGDGDQAMQFLRRSGRFAGAPRPALIVLDLNLPRRTGLEVLADLNADQDLLTIPVLILTTPAARPMSSGAIRCMPAPISQSRPTSTASPTRSGRSPAGSRSSSSFRAGRNGQRILVPPIACRGYGDG